VRDYTKIDSYLNELLDDVYPQPVDPGHLRMATDIIGKWISRISDRPLSILDVGCGEAFVQSLFESQGCIYTGVTLGQDAKIAQDLGRNVLLGDFHFLDFHDQSFDLVFSRHSLEHSPMPLLALMEWHRVARAWMVVVLPNPVHYAWEGKNHYSVMSRTQALSMLLRAGWNAIWTDDSEETELRFMCEKRPRLNKTEDWFGEEK
jgi:SAM-dependent methyltransferase